MTSRALVWLMLMVAAGARAQAPDVPMISGAIYVVRPLASLNLCLEVQGAGTASGSLAGTWDFLEANHQRWRFLDAGNGSWQLEPVHVPGKRLEVAYGAVTNGSSVRIADATGNPQQKWLISHQGGGAYRLVPLSNASGCLSVQDAMTSKGAKVQQWQISSSGLHQLWKIESEIPVLDNAVYHFSLGSATNVVVEIASPAPGSSPATGTRRSAAPAHGDHAPQNQWLMFKGSEGALPGFGAVVGQQDALVHDGFLQRCARILRDRPGWRPGPCRCYSSVKPIFSDTCQCATLPSTT